MKICFVYPKANYISHNPKFVEFWNTNKHVQSYRKNWSGLTPAIPTLIALTPKTFDITVIDENKEGLDYSTHYDLVAISLMTQQAVRAYEIADHYRSKGIRVILGGIHPTVLPDEAKMHADAVVIGEAENLWKGVLEDFCNGKLQDFYKTDKLTDLSNMPIPAYECLKDKEYSVLWVQNSRGCPHDCEFCAASKIYGHSYRIKNTDLVISEIEKIQKLFGKIWIAFGDDNFVVNKRVVKDLLEKMSVMNLRWACESDISVAEDDEILLLLRKSGCSFLFTGLESIDESGLLNIDKNNWKMKKRKKYTEYIQKIQSYGIGVMGSFILGLENDNESVFQNVTDFIIENNLYEANISILTPLPGTRLRERLLSENRVLKTSWDNYTLYDVNFVHPVLTKEQLEDGLVKIYREIHSDEVYEKKLEYFKQIQLNLIKKGLI
jgi:radical SAM superfamily enzyme YgiQ (UPF0313 family)